ncbi:hypothetical protein JRD95_01203 [Rickettsia parkeri]|nr:hypothetical protein JRD95_01203 [Rickettsia parkeri]
MDYLFIKTMHIISSTTLFGTAFFLCGGQIKPVI